MVIAETKRQMHETLEMKEEEIAQLRARIKEVTTKGEELKEQKEKSDKAGKKFCRLLVFTFKHEKAWSFCTPSSVVWNGYLRDALFPSVLRAASTRVITTFESVGLRAVSAINTNGVREEIAEGQLCFPVWRRKE